MKFEVGTKVIVVDSGSTGVVSCFQKYSETPYQVCFATDSDSRYDWYTAKQLKPLSNNQLIVDQSNCAIDSPKVTVPMEIKPEGRKYDSGKPRYSLLPPLALEEVVHVLTFGSQKYEDFNWMKVQNANDRYFSAANRHLWQWKRGEIMDEETKRHHLASAITNLMFILEMELISEEVT